MSIVKAIDKAIKSMEKRGWNKIYFYFDIHETILYPDYTNEDPLKFYEHAEEVLQYLSQKKEITIALFTCSYPKEIERYVKFFAEHGIVFEYANHNPDVKNTLYGFYEDKPYFNVLFEDKAGFDAENDWILVKEYFEIGVEINKFAA